MIDILVIDDDPDVRASVSDALADAGHRVLQAADVAHATKLIGLMRFDLALCDVRLPDGDGASLLRRIRREAPSTSVVMMTSFGTVSDVVGALRDGAIDYVTKPFDPYAFTHTVVRAIDEGRERRRRIEEARAAIAARDADARIVAASQLMRATMDRVAIAAQSDASLLVTGEQGVGKSLVARTVHATGPRRDGPFVVVPCASLPDLMLESELAEIADMRPRRDAWLRAAEGGTLVLDGIDLLPIGAQGALLRALEEPGVVARRGGDWRPSGVRIVSIARDGVGAPDRWLEGLAYRLRAIEIAVPALRHRPADLSPLVAELLCELMPRACSAPDVTRRAWDALAAYSFPGNVRELRWVLERAASLARGGAIDVEHLPREIAAAA